MAQMMDESTGTRARHRLAPLLPEEITQACAAVLSSGQVDPAARVVYCALAEPPREGFFSPEGPSVPREAMVVTYERPLRRTSMISVSLETGAVTGCTHLEGEQPPIMLEEWVANAEAIKKDPGYQAALAKRGVTDLDLVQIDPWPASWFGDEVDRAGRRITRAVSYRLDAKGDNAYAHPIENLVVIADRDNGEVIEIQDGDVVPVPAPSGRYDAAAQGELRELAPLEITQRNGPGFTVDDGALAWGPWRMRVSLHPIEGLVLHEVGYVEGERLRPLMYRASMCEMVVPYGSTSLNHYWKNAFDAGDVGLGKMVNSLELGCDCLGEIVYLDAAMADEDGTAQVTSNAICLHEEDYGILWKHVDMMGGVSEVRRSRRLVVSTIATVGNYEYGFFWYFYLDGTVQAEIKLTGIIQTQAVSPGERVPFANPVTPELAGPHHQHMFSYRLDMCVDGPSNAVYEVDAVGLPPGPDNPYGNAFDAQSTLLSTESEAQRLADPMRGRYWKIVNHGSRNAVGEPVAYKLIPTHAGAPLLASESATISARAGFARKHLWVTPYAPSERRAAGDFPNQHPGGAGLPAWTAADRPVVDTGIVLWHTVGTTHFTRPEDYPVMPVEYAGFTLKPFGFFDRNPAMDLAPSGGDHCHP